MAVGSLLTQAFSLSQAKYSALCQTWVKISHRFADLPLVANSIQREAHTDLLIRCLEDESLLPNWPLTEPLTPTYLHSLSCYWIGGVYEVFRLLKERGLLETCEAADVIFRDLELLRMPIEKLEIAHRRNELKEPLELFREAKNGASPEPVWYDPKDPLRSIQLPMKHSRDTGSLQWRVIDVRNKRDYWVERRWLSNKIIDLWNRPRFSTEAQARAADNWDEAH